LEVFQDELYAFVGNHSTGLQVLRTTNGTDWQPIWPSGFANADNAIVYWDNSIYVYGDSLWAGTLNMVSGGKVWQSVCMTHGVYMPLVVRDHGP
jgi:hypothetical protein